MASFPVRPNRVGLFVSYESPLCGKSLETPLTVSLICRRNTEYYFLQANSASRTRDLRKRQVALEPLCVTPVPYYTEMLLLLIVHNRSMLLTLFFRFSVPQLMKERVSLSNIPICIDIYNPLNSGNSFPS